MDDIIIKLSFSDEAMQDAEVMAETAEEMIQDGLIDEQSAEQLIVGILFTGAEWSE